MSDRDIVSRLPYRLRNRFESLGAYVKAVIDEEQRGTQKNMKLKRDHVQLIQLIVFIHCLDDFLREGTNAARGAVEGLGRLGIDGFSVGSTEFSGNNENVARGEVLADQLRAAVAEMDLFNSLPSNVGPTQLTQELIRRIKHA